MVSRMDEPLQVEKFVIRAPENSSLDNHNDHQSIEIEEVRG